MNKRFRNIKKKIENLLLSNKYYVTIIPEKKKSFFEANYHFKTIYPYGKKRNLLK